MTRTLAVLGASNTGKSTLVDRFCTVEGGQTQPAAAPGEMRICGFEHLGERWQAIDTPGSIEALHVARAALLAADAAVIGVAPDPDAAPLAAPWLPAAGRVDIFHAGILDGTPRPNTHMYRSYTIGDRAWQGREGWKEDQTWNEWSYSTAGPGAALTVDLESRLITAGDLSIPFEVDDYTRWRLLEGLDDVGLTLRHEQLVAEFEARRPAYKPVVQ